MTFKNKIPRIYENLPKELRECIVCHWALPLSEFNVRYKSGGLYTDCRKCRSVRRQQNMRDNPIRSKRVVRAGNLRRNFNITIEEYDSIYINQGGCCAICGIHQSKLNRRFAVDYCHETGVVRGLLCGNCNNGLGRFMDNTNRLRNAIKYIESSE